LIDKGPSKATQGYRDTGIQGYTTMSQSNPTRLLSAIERNFAEISNALLKITAHEQLCCTEITYCGPSFFLIAMDALVNDAFAHAIKVLDKHRDAVSFWYVLKCEDKVVRKAARDAGVDMHQLEELSEKLRMVRVKTHFHIDREAVIDPEAVWKEVNLAGNTLINQLKGLADTLARTKQMLIGGELSCVTPYDGSDVPMIVSAYEQCYGPVHGVPPKS
jgi:hypothetical protein